MSVHCPLTDDTRGLIDAKALGAMKPSAFLINTARGALVNEADLVDAQPQTIDAESRCHRSKQACECRRVGDENFLHPSGSALQFQPHGALILELEPWPLSLEPRALSCEPCVVCFSPFACCFPLDAPEGLTLGSSGGKSFGLLLHQKQHST